MTYKTVVALFENEESAPVLAEAAIAIASTYKGHIIGLCGETVDPLPVYSPFDVPDAQLMAALYASAAAKREALANYFEKTIGKSDVPHEWRVYRGTSGSTSRGMVETARCADLVVSTQPRAGFPSEFNDLLFESGRPVLFIPWINRSYHKFGRVLVAWDGSREATRAAFDAIPFMKGADEVEIFSVDPQDTRSQSASMTGVDLATVLDRHGIKASIATAISADLSISAVIENRVTEISADLLVMGAYSHSRVRETIFGGVTRTLLESMTTATLMSR